MKKIDFLAIGDMVTDAFITLQDARVTCDINNRDCTISMRWGDKIPYQDVTIVRAVGNSPNASVSAKRLGLSSAIMSHVGDDEEGIRCLKHLEQEGIDTDFMTQEQGMKTNYHYVLSYEAERTILIKHEKFSYDLHKQISGKVTPQWIYLSSFGEHGVAYHDQIATWVKENNIKMAFQPGTFQIKLGTEQLKEIYQLSELFFCNVEEAQRILHTTSRDLETLLKSIHEHGPRIVVITDGTQGAYAFDGTANESWFQPIYPDPQPPIERTGAGDAFASTFTSAIILGKSIPEALQWAPINSMNVVQHIGAQAGLLQRNQLEKLLAEAPANYQCKRIF